MEQLPYSTLVPGEVVHCDIDTSRVQMAADATQPRRDTTSTSQSAVRAAHTQAISIHHSGHSQYIIDAPQQFVGQPVYYQQQPFHGLPGRWDHTNNTNYGTPNHRRVTLRRLYWTVPIYVSSELQLITVKLLWQVKKLYPKLHRAVKSYFFKNTGSSITSFIYSTLYQMGCRAKGSLLTTMTLFNRFRRPGDMAVLASCGRIA